MKNVLVTGSLGYIGTELVPFLNKKGKSTVGLDPGFFKDCTLYPPKIQRTLLKDVRNITYDNLSDLDVVVHLAGISNDPFGNLKAEQVYDPTYQYSMQLADMCKKFGIKMIFASSCSVYGKSATTDILDEKSPTNPQTPYSLNKLQIEDGLKEKADKDFKPIMLRFATIFGPSARMRFDLFINMFAGMIVTNKEIVLNSDGTSWRPSVYIEDILNAVDYAINFEPNESLTLNVGRNDNNYRVIDIAKMFTEIVPNTKISFIFKDKKLLESKQYELVKDKKIQEGVDLRTYKVSFEEISKTFTRFECKYTVKEGIKKLLKTLVEKKLDETKFKNMRFYRLQKFDYLLKTNQITNQIRWTK